MTDADGSGSQEVTSDRARPALKGKSKARWEEILRSAAKRFYDLGYEATSIRDVAADANINKGSLYYYIDSKEDLLLAVIRDVHEHGLVVIETARGFDGSAVARLRTFLYEHTLHQANNAIAAAVFDREARHLSADALSPFIIQRESYQAFVEELLLAVDSERPIELWGDERTTAIALLAMTNSLHAWYQPTGLVPPAKIAERVVDFAMRGLRLVDD